MEVIQSRSQLYKTLGISGVVLLLIAGAIFSTVSVRRYARDVVRLSAARELYFGLELFHAANNDYPKGSTVALGGMQAGCLDNTGFHARGTCSGTIYLPVILPDIDGKPFSYSYDAGPPGAYVVQFITEGSIQNFKAGNHVMNPNTMK